MMKIMIFCFVFAFHFQETSETFSGSNKLEIFTGKRLKSRREKNRESDFAPPPPEKFPCYAPVHSYFSQCLRSRDVLWNQTLSHNQ